MAKPTQTTCAGMVKYLENLEGYAGQTADPAAVIERKSGDVSNQILGLKDASEEAATPLMAKISDLPFQNDTKQNLISAVDHKVASAPVPNTDRKNSYCPTFAASYLTEQDWKDIANKSLTAAIKTITYRANKYGMGCAAEVLQGQMAIVISVANEKNNHPSATHLKQRKEDVRKDLKDYDASDRFPYQHIVHVTESQTKSKFAPARAPPKTGVFC